MSALAVNSHPLLSIEPIFLLIVLLGIPKEGATGVAKTSPSFWFLK